MTLQQAQAAIDGLLARLMLPSDVIARPGDDGRSLQRTLQDQPWLILGVLVAVYLVLGVLYESLAFSQLLTLYTTPVIYLVLDRMRLRVRGPYGAVRAGGAG